MGFAGVEESSGAAWPRCCVDTTSWVEYSGAVGELIGVAIDRLDEAVFLLGGETGRRTAIEERVEIGCARTDNGVEALVGGTHCVDHLVRQPKRSVGGPASDAFRGEPMVEAAWAGGSPDERANGESRAARAGRGAGYCGLVTNDLHTLRVSIGCDPSWLGRVSTTAVVQIGSQIWQTVVMSDVIEALSDDAKAERLKALQSVIDLIRPVVQQDGGDLALVGADVEVGIVEVQLQGSCSSCAVSSTTLQAGVSRILKDRLPWVTDVLGGVDESIDTETSRSMGMGGYVPREDY